jgi:hypothetical protein
MAIDYTRLSYPQQLQLLANGDPAAVRACAELWSEVTSSLYSRAGDLEQQLREFEPYWTGIAAEQYKTMMRNLIGGIRQIADVARLIVDNVYSAGEALATAKQRAAAPLAVADLARVYAALEAAIPQMPQLAPPPTADAILFGNYQPHPSLLFSDVYRNGIAAAAAALGGRFSGALEGIVGPPPPPPPPPPVTVPPPIASPVAMPAAASFGSFPDRSIGRASVEPVSFAEPMEVTPSAAPPLAAPSSAPGNPAGGGFFPPMMPPVGAGMAGGGDGFGSDRAVPVWLTEPEPEVVFGVPLQAVGSVIGEDPAQWNP